MSGLNSELIFALDVGTRKVAGLLARLEGGTPKVLAWSMREHDERAMLDGQVHLVAPAARVVAAVKRDLEARTGQQLRRAHVAVAGRALMTQEAVIEAPTPGSAPLTRQDVLGLELQAVREARARLSDPRALAGVYSVGHSVTETVLDGMPLGALEGHAGTKVRIKVLATFLPKQVLDSLLEVLRLCDLGAASLTLEPIAAAAIALPDDLRRLNLAMVDVGAGTSDIALARDGRINAFAMAPLAGDELSERLSERYLLDFSQAELLKRAAAAGEDHVAQDLFGNPRALGAPEVWNELAPAVAQWAAEVAARILELNGGKAPQATLLVGGGSQIPGMELALAEQLGVPAARVGRRPAELQRRFTGLPPELAQAWATTPLGIAAMALDQRGLPFLEFSLNGQPRELLHLGQPLSVFDALLAAGEDLANFNGRPGAALTWTVDGELRVARGGAPIPARVRVDGAPASLDRPLLPGATIHYEPAIAGADAQLSLAEALAQEGRERCEALFNGKALRLPGLVSLNGREAPLQQALVDRDAIVLRASVSLAELLRAEGLALPEGEERSVAVTVRGEPKVLLQRAYSLSLNGREADLASPVAPGDRVEFSAGQALHLKVRDVLGPQEPRPFSITLNGAEREVQLSPVVLLNGHECSLDEYVIDGATLETRTVIPSVEGFLRSLGVDAAPLLSGAWTAWVDGNPAQWDSPLRQGAELKLAPVSAA